LHRAQYLGWPKLTPGWAMAAVGRNLPGAANTITLNTQTLTTGLPAPNLNFPFARETAISLAFVTTGFSGHVSCKGL